MLDKSERKALFSAIASESKRYIKEQLDPILTRLSELEIAGERDANALDQFRAQIANLRRGKEEEKNVRIQ